MSDATLPAPESPSLKPDVFGLFSHSGARGWWPLVGGVGVLCGLIGAAYVEALRALTRVIGPERHTLTVHLLVLVAVGVVIGILMRVLGSPGDVEMLVDNIHVGGQPSDMRALRSLIPVSLLGIAAGSAIGPEAALVQTTGTTSNRLAERLGLDVVDSRVLTIAGMAAAFAVLFGAPLGAALFALEILHRRGLEYYEAVLPSAIGALSGWVVFIALTRAGFEPIWQFPRIGTLSFADLGLGVLAGAGAAVVAIAFTYTVKGMRWAFRQLPELARPAVGGLLLGGLSFVSPYALTFGEAQVQHIVSVRLAVGTLVLAAVCKLLATSVVMSAGWRGGFIIPLFFVGAAIGTAASHGVSGHQLVLLSATMAAVNVGVTKTPLGSTAVVAEMSGLRILPAVLVASLVSLFLTSRVSLIETQRARS
jgi:H+/Cl- antiporter ClcA